MIETGLLNKVVIVTWRRRRHRFRPPARRFAQEGCRVASWDVKDTGAETGRHIPKGGCPNGASVEAAVEDVFARWEPSTCWSTRRHPARRATGEV